MPLTLPRLDDRSYDDLVTEALARISVHTPEWTNFNDADPGITLLQLHAWMMESVLYRANLIPSRNQLKFLTLLGIPMRPAAAAIGVVTLSNDRGPLQTVTLPSGLALSAGPVGFKTSNGLDVLPIEGRVYYKAPLSPAAAAAASATYTQLYATYDDGATTFEFYQTTPFDPPTNAANIPSLDVTGTDTVDHIVWIALLARTADAATLSAAASAIAGKTITLGIMPAVDTTQETLSPIGSPTSAAQVSLIYELSTGTTDANGAPIYTPFNERVDADPFTDLTLAQLTLPSDPSKFGVWTSSTPLTDGVGDLPPAIDDPTVASRLLAWVRIRLPSTDGTVTARFTWFGINAARITQRIDVSAESVGAGTGEPDQMVAVVNTPVLPDTVQLVVGGEFWALTDDLLSAPPEVPVRDPSLPPGASSPPAGDPRLFTVDAESGQIRFGDGLRGKRPPLGAAIYASYAYGGGSIGNVGIGAVKTGPLLPAGYKVANPLPTWGGADGQTIDQAVQDIPRFLQHQNRAVSEADFIDIVNATPGVDVGRVDVVPLYGPGLTPPSPGVVTVLVVPSDPVVADTPAPDKFFLDAVCNYLDSRRLVTTEIYVTGPTYVDIDVSIGFDIVPGLDFAPVRDAIKAAVQTFLSPLYGGINRTGYPLTTPLEDRELVVQVARVPGVLAVNGVLLWDPTGQQTTVQFTDLQLPQLRQLSVVSGDPQDLGATAPPPPPSTTRLLPVPVAPATC